MSIFGVWMWPQSIELQGAQKTISYCSRAGITDIYFLTKGLKGETAYPSEFAPAMCSRDLLSELLCAAHGKGVRVHAWFTSACDAHYKKLHPESGRYHFQRGRDRELISLTDEGYLAYMKSIIGEVCSKYDIDGLHLDYIRYNHLLYGWAEEDLQRYAMNGADVNRLRELVNRTFYDETSKDPDCIFNAFRTGAKSVLSLARTRRADVVRFAEALIGTARSQRQNLTISAALMPEGAYDDVAFADLHYGQNYEDAAGLYDYVLPMAYSAAYHEDGQWVRKIAEGSVRRGLRPIMGLHAYDGGTSLSLRQDQAALADAPIDGICLFREGAFIYAFTDGEKIDAYNPTCKAVTSLRAASGGRSHFIETNIGPGEEKTFSLPFAADTLSAFSSDEELCLHLTVH